MKNIKLARLLIALFLVCNLFVINEVQSKAVIPVNATYNSIFIDDNLALCVANNFGDNVDDIVNETELESLTVLNCSDININSIEGVQYLINLQELYFINTKGITDISPISNLVKLEKINFQDNQVVDITPLSNLIDLEVVSFLNNEISNLEPLENLNQLTILTLGNNNIYDISPLDNLVNLNDLHLYGNNISDISALQNLINLKVLSLEHNNICDISALQNLVNLEILSLESNNINDISSLEKLVNLEYLNVGSNQITDISVVKNMKKLKTLQIQYNNIADISATNSLPNLNLLIANGQKINLTIYESKGYKTPAPIISKFDIPIVYKFNNNAYYNGLENTINFDYNDGNGSFEFRSDVNNLNYIYSGTIDYQLVDDEVDTDPIIEGNKSLNDDAISSIQTIDNPINTSTHGNENVDLVVIDESNNDEQIDSINYNDDLNFAMNKKGNFDDVNKINKKRLSIMTMSITLALFLLKRG